MNSNFNELYLDQNYSFPGGFSVLMAVYKNDDPALLKKSLYSILYNSLQPDSIILIQDGPIPVELSNVINNIIILTDKFNFLRIDKNVGLANALNYGLTFVRTDWVVRSDADDVNCKDRFKLQAKFVHDNPGVTLFGGEILEVDKFDRPLSVRSVPKTHEIIKKSIRYRCPFNHMTVAYKTDLIRLCGGYPNIYLKEDYALWAKMISLGAITSNLSCILVHATTGSDFFKRRGGLKYAAAECELQMFLYKTGIQSIFVAFFMLISRFCIFIMPVFMRAKIYKTLLRNP